MNSSDIFDHLKKKKEMNNSDVFDNLKNEIKIFITGAKNKY